VRNLIIMCRGGRSDQASYPTKASVIAPLETEQIQSGNLESAPHMPSPIRRLLSSTVGNKLLIGLTGLGLFVYLITHLAGNAIIFLGADAFNGYAHALTSNPVIVLIEIGLLLLFLAHIYKAITNYLKNQTARPERYQVKAYAGHTSRKSVSSSSMIVTGIIIAIFVIIHVKQFRFGTYYLVNEGEVRDLFRTEIEVFSNPLWVGFYVIATLLVGLHLRHGIASGFQSLGLDHPKYTGSLTAVSLVLALIISGGLAFIPVWVYFTY
jgi:succinate dehydrogenase / fumarate reductase cytochrome b subunit